MKKNIRLVLVIALATAQFFSCQRPQEQEENKVVVPPTPNAPDPVVSFNTILSGYEIIWGMDVLPNGDLLFGERRGKLYLRSGDKLSEISGFPQVRTGGQGGLLDIRLHPDYATNGWVYATYSATASGNSGELRLVRFKLANNQVQNLEQLFKTGGGNTWNGHYGSRILFDRKGHLLLAIGEGGSGTYAGPRSSNRNSQDTGQAWGKIHRLREDGSIPPDNPVLPGGSTPGSIFAYGVRNPQGLALHPVTGEIWEAEHGPRGGDELNIIQSGANYGWPNYSLGVNYDGTAISQGHTAAGIAEPRYVWTPSIGVCGIAFITADAFKSWKGNLLATGLAAQKLYRLVLEDNKVKQQSVLLENSGRVRNVVQGANGKVYVSLEGPGRIVEISAQ